MFNDVLNDVVDGMKEAVDNISDEMFGPWTDVPRGPAQQATMFMATLGRGTQVGRVMSGSVIRAEKNLVTKVVSGIGDWFVKPMTAPQLAKHIYSKTKGGIVGSFKELMQKTGKEAAEKGLAAGLKAAKEAGSNIATKGVKGLAQKAGLKVGAALKVGKSAGAKVLTNSGKLSNVLGWVDLAGDLLVDSKMDNSFWMSIMPGTGIAQLAMAAYNSVDDLVGGKLPGEDVGDAHFVWQKDQSPDVQ